VYHDTRQQATSARQLNNSTAVQLLYDLPCLVNQMTAQHAYKGWLRGCAQAQAASLRSARVRNACPPLWC
jgi:hypothetical protein